MESLGHSQWIVRYWIKAYRLECLCGNMTASAASTLVLIADRTVRYGEPRPQRDIWVH